MFLGHSNTSKTTAMILAAADAQKKGHLPVLIITEKKWSWEHAIELGLQAEKTNLVSMMVCSFLMIRLM
jgi:hypothetical protein